MAPANDALRSVHTTNLPELFRQLGISLVVSTYQAGKVILIRADGDKLNTHFRTFGKPMGIAADRARLTIGGANTVWFYRNVPAVAAKIEPAGKHDACFLPRRLHVTGDIDIHEMAYDQSGELWVVNTRFCCLSTLDVDHSFTPRWRPPFVSAYAPEDRCHLNGLALGDGRVKYVTALGETDAAGGWRVNKKSGGLLMDVETNEILLRGLSMPHSPRWYRGKLWLLESGDGGIAIADLARGTWQTIARLPGFTRGIDFVGPIAFVGLSQVRESATFSGIPLVERLNERTCGVWVVNLETGQTLGFIRFEAGVQEIFAVQVLHGIRFPELLEWNDERLSQSYVLPDEALAQVALPKPEDLERSPLHHLRRGIELHRTGKLDESIAAFERSLELEPKDVNARLNLGVALGDAGRHDEATAQLEQVVAEEPNRAEAWNSLGFAASRRGDPRAAVAHYEHAIERRPDWPQAHFNLGMTLLLLGEYERGWVEYDWRWKTGEFTPFQAPHPLWDGSPIPDKTLLLHTEQGAGDAIQLARFIPLAAERARKVILVCKAELAPLFATVPGIAELREAGRIGVNEFDAYLPLMSLPRVFGTTLETIPNRVPYLDVEAIRRRKGGGAPSIAADGRYRVGLVWAGSPTHKNDRHRSLALRELLPILRTPGVSFHALQVGDRRTDLAELSAGVTVTDLGDQLRDYGDTALAIDALDLMIGVDTSVVHLAGALAKPVWTLLPLVPDWRWLTTGSTTPWYPTMRLFRQLASGDWSPVVAEVAGALAARRAA